MEIAECAEADCRSTVARIPGRTIGAILAVDAGRTLWTCRSVGSAFANRTRCTLRTLWPYWSLRALRTLFPLRTLFARQTWVALRPANVDRIDNIVDQPTGPDELAGCW